MPRVQITLKDGTNKIVEFEDGFTESDIEEVAGHLNSQIRTSAPNNAQPQETKLTGKVEKYNPQYADILSNNSLTREQKAQAIQERGEAERKQYDKELRKDYGRIGAGGLVQAAAMHPVFNIPYVGTGLGGALFGAGNAIVNGRNASDIGKEALIGFGAGETLGAIPYVGKAISKTKAAQALGNKIANSAVGKATGEVINNIANSKAVQRAAEVLGTDVDNNIAGQTVAKIGNALGVGKKALAQNAEANIETPVMQETIEKTIPEKITKKGLENQAKQMQNEMKDLQVDLTPKTTIAMSKQGRFWNKNIDDPMTKDIRNAEEELNGIIKEIQKNPELVKDINQVNALENRLTNKLGIADEIDEGFYNKFYDAINKADEINKTLELAGDYTQRGLPRTVINAKGTPKEVKEILKNDFPEYKVLHNNELTDQAVQEVESNFNNELSRLTSAKDFEAIDYEKSRQIAKRLFDMGRHEEAINLIDNVSENATKKGQAIQALSLWSNMTPEGAVYKAEKLIKEYNKKVPARKQVKLTTEQKVKIRELQIEALNATDDLSKTQGLARTAKYVSELVPKNIGQKLKSYRNISLLLNPKTLGRNIIGNALFNTVDTVSKAAAVVPDRIIGAFTGQKTRVVPQLKELVQGGIKGAKTGFQEALEGIDTRGLGKRFDLQEGRTFKNPVMRGLETALDVGLRVPDRMQYEATFAESVANMMKAQGLSQPTQEILEQAEKEALESVFQNDSAISGLTTKVRRAMNTIGTKDFGLGDLAIPYAQTPANLVQQAINYSPAGFLKGAGNLLQGNQRQASLDLARALIGSGLIGGSYGLSKTGVITPSQFDENYQKNKTIKANLKPLGISTGQIGDVWYEPFQPMSTSIAIGNAMANGENPLQAGLNTMLDLPFLQNVNRGLSDIKDKGIAEAGINFASSIPAQFAPTVLSQVGQVIDPYQRETYDSNKLMQGVNQAVAKIPVASKTLPEKIDVTGKPIERYESKGPKRLFDIFLNPTYVTQKKDDITLSELKRLYDETGNTKQFLPVVDKKISYKNEKGENIKLELTGKELSTYQKQVGVTSKKILDDVINSDFYKNLDNEDKINLINTITKNTVDAIDEKLFNKPSVQKRKLIKELTKTSEDEIIKDVLNTYKKDILPMQIESIQKREFN